MEFCLSMMLQPGIPLKTAVIELMKSENTETKMLLFFKSLIKQTSFFLEKLLRSPSVMHKTLLTDSTFLALQKLQPKVALMSTKPSMISAKF